MPMMFVPYVLFSTWMEMMSNMMSNMMSPKEKVADVVDPNGDDAGGRARYA